MKLTSGFKVKREICAGMVDGRKDAVELGSLADSFEVVSTSAFGLVCFGDEVSCEGRD